MQNYPAAQRYRSCLVMSGGGFRFGYFLGMYSALCQSGRSPEVILATCGGAIAAGIIRSIADDAQRKDWLCSTEMHQFWLDHTSTRKATIVRTFLNVIKRYFNDQEKKWPVPDLFNDYLFDIPERMPLPPPGQLGTNVEVAIVAAELLFEECDGLHSISRNGPLFREAVFCSPRTAHLLDGMTAPASDGGCIKNRVSDRLVTQMGVPLEHAVRASVADMFLFRCHSYGGKNYSGGIIDLVPIELANRIAQNVMVEVKAPYDHFISSPALRTVFGFDGNRRLANTRRQSASLWIDTSDMERVLVSGQISRRLNWLKNRVELTVPRSYEVYVRSIQDQWDYGYRRTLDSLLLASHSSNSKAWPGAGAGDANLFS